MRVLAGRNVDFKIGDDAGGLLRPDKMVAYFGAREELDDVGAALRARLAGCPAHGVPFTAGLGDDGLLSWGLDPPESERALSWLGRESWRLWLAAKLGAAIAFAKTWSRRARGAVEFRDRARPPPRRRRRSLDPERVALEARMNIADPIVLRNDIVLLPIGGAGGGGARDDRIR